MFLDKYLNDTKLFLLSTIYKEEYINNLDYNKFIKIYNLFKEYNFYFIDDIILDYLEIFQMDYDEVKKGIIFLKEKLGAEFVYIIGSDMRYLEFIQKENTSI